MFWMDHVIGGQGSDRLHGSIDKMIGEWENDGVKMIGVADKVGANVDDARRVHGRARDRELMATNDGSSAEEYDEMTMVDEDVKRMIDLATKL